MSDLAPAIAALLVEDRAALDAPDDLLFVLAQRFPDAREGDVLRGLSIALEVLCGQIVDAQVLAVAPGAEEEPQPAVAAQDRCWWVAAALHGWDEAEVCALAQGSGIPVAVLIPIIAALRRGPPAS